LVVPAVGCAGPPAPPPLTKQRADLEATLARASKKLANEGFLAKAAPEVVAQEREKHDRLVTQLAEVDAQLAELG
jgi:valyl-tRNA synthetase